MTSFLAQATRWIPCFAAVLAAAGVPVTAQDMPHRWEIGLHAGWGAGQGVAAAIEQQLNVQGYGTDVPCPASWVGRFCGGTDVFRYPTHGSEIRMSTAGSVGFWVRPNMLVSVHLARAELAAATGYDAASNHEVRTLTTMEIVAIVPTLVVREGLRVGAGPALPALRIRAEVTEWSQRAVQAVAINTKRTPGVMLVATMATRSRDPIGFEVSAQHVLAGSVDVEALTMQPGDPPATLSVGPISLKGTSTAIRAGVVIRLR